MQVGHERTGWLYYDANAEAIEEYDSDGLITKITTKDGKATTIVRKSTAAEHALFTDYQGKSLSIYL